THDQDEALTMSDRIAVFNEGRIVQLGTPAEIYEFPASEFVAGFVGTSNLLRDETARAILGSDGTWSIRPEKIRIAAVGTSAGESERAVNGTVREVIYVGMSTRMVIDLAPGGTLVAVEQNSGRHADQRLAMRGQDVTLLWSTEHEYSVN
ncbi:MAG: hypothetical protein RL205_1024, partial [Actinomycetota bacterium]